MLVASQVAPGKPEILHCLDISDEERRRQHGIGTHSPIDRLTVSESTTVTFEYQVGEIPVETGGELLVVWRWPFDWSDLKFENVAGDGFMRAEVLPADGREPSDVALKLRYNWLAGIEPWHHQIQVKVTNGELRQGDRVRLICGDTDEGGEGWRSPTCAAERCQFLMLVDHQGDNKRIRLVRTPTFPVQPDRPERIVAIVHSDAVVNEPVEVIVRAEDRWGNPTALDSPPSITVPSLSSDDSQFQPISSPTIRPVYRYNVTFAKTGHFRVEVSSEQCEGVAQSNFVTVHDTKPSQQLFWGDLHSGQTEIGCGGGSLAEHYAFGRDCAGLQFITHQANDHYVTLDDWNHTREVTKEFYEAGRYVALLGCEWSPLTKDGGDRNVYYRDDDPVLRRSDRFFREDDPDPTPDARTAPEFHDAFRDLDVLVNIHVGGRMTNLEWYDQQIEKLCETHSTHGTVEWFFMDALSRGYRVGLTAGTDGVMGRPGACHPGRRLIRNLRNGLTAIYAEDLTRESVWEALQNRRCYATTGERIRVWFEADGHPMGSEYSTDKPPRFDFRVQGTCAIERVELFRGIEPITSWNVSPSLATDESQRLRVLWGGTERRGTARLQRVNWDGSLTINDGELRLADSINFQSCDDVARSVEANRIEWSSKTAGNAAGIVIEIVGTESSELTIATEPFTQSFRIGDLTKDGNTVDAGGVNRFVRFGPPPDPAGPTSFEQSFVDAEPKGGVMPYWLRVTQIDQSLAWSSPVYITYK